MNRPILAALRRPHPTQQVTVTLTGTPAAVTALARLLAAVVPVTGMRHTPTRPATGPAEQIRLDVSCLAPTRRAA